LDTAHASWSVHTDSVYCVAFHPKKNDTIASGGGDEVGYILTAGQEEPVAKLEGHKDSINAAAFSHDGKYLALASLDATVSIWDPEKGKQHTSFDGPGESVECFVWHDRGPVLFAGCGDGTGWLWNVQTKSTMMVLSGHSERINDAVFSTDGKKIITVSDDATLRVWDPKNGLCLHVIKGHMFHVEPATSVACYTDNATCLSGGLDHVGYVSNIITGKSLGELKGHEGSVEDTAFVTGFPWAMTASMDGRIGVWDLHTLQNRAWITNSEDIGITRMCQHGTTVFAGDVRGRVSMWDSRIGGAVIRRWQAHGDAIMDLDISHDGQFIASVSDDHTVKMFSVAQ
jgi:angio-associated migratory cell protein